MDLLSPTTAALIGLVLLFVLYALAISIHRIFLHPLASFPGPKLAALTYAYEIYFDVFVSPGGQYFFEIDRLHDIYGPVVRINPEEIHVRDSNFFDTLYAGPGHRRDKWARAIRANGSPGAVSSALNHDLHRTRRAAINPFFSKRAIMQLESRVRERVERLVARLQDEYAGTDRVVDVGVALTAVTFDVISEYCFADSYNVLEEADFGPQWKALMAGLFEAVPVTKQLPIIGRVVAALPAAVGRILIPGMELLVRMKSQIDIRAREVYSDLKDHEGEADTEAPPKTIFHGIMQSALPSNEKTIENLSDESFVLLVAGGETTARVMTVVLVQLLENPEMLARLRSELDPAMRQGLPTSRVLEAIPFLKAVIHEGNRLATPVTNRQILIATDEELETSDGWIIPRNTPTSMAIRDVSMDANIFPEPETFNPDRWLGSERLDRYLVTFSKGSRSCVGMNLACAEMYLGIAAVVSAFDLEPFDFDQKRDLDIVRDCFIGMPSKDSRGIRVKVKTRKM